MPRPWCCETPVRRAVLSGSPSPPQVPYGTQSRAAPRDQGPLPVRPGVPLGWFPAGPAWDRILKALKAAFNIQIVQQLSLPPGPGRSVPGKPHLPAAPPPRDSGPQGVGTGSPPGRGRRVPEGPGRCLRPLVRPDLQSPPDHPPPKQKLMLVAAEGGISTNGEGAAMPTVGSCRIISSQRKRGKGGKSLSSCFCFSCRNCLPHFLCSWRNAPCESCHFHTVPPLPGAFYISGSGPTSPAPVPAPVQGVSGPASP